VRLCDGRAPTYDQPMTLAVAIAALVLSMISLAFTAYQWRRSGPALVVALEMHSMPGFTSWSTVDGQLVIVGQPGDAGGVNLKAEIMSAGRMSVSVRKARLEVGGLGLQDMASDVPVTVSASARSASSWGYQVEPLHVSEELPVTLAPTAVLEAEFQLAAKIDKEERTMTVNALAQSGARWTASPQFRIALRPR
jgi:hypothetical protein